MAFDIFDFSQTKKWLNKNHKNEISTLLQASFKDVSPDDYFNQYFASDACFQRKLRLYYHHGKLVGYCLITFANKGGDILLNASAAFYPEHRKGSNTFTYSLKQAFRYWLKHPFKSIYYADTMLSPAMYRATVKQTAIAWPSINNNPPAYLFEQFNSLGSLSNKVDLRCLVNVGRSTNYDNEDITRFRQSNKKEIAYYCQINPDFDKGIALFVIIPISFKQFILTGLKALIQ